MEKKRTRSVNYTGDEKILLLNLVRDLKHIIENKTTDAVTNKKKEECWENITNQFNARAPNKTYRTTESLKKFYENVKKKTRQEVANERMSHIQTGGGDEYKIRNEAHSLALSVMNPKSVNGSNNKFDDDTDVMILIGDEGVNENVEEEYLIMELNNNDNENSILNQSVENSYSIQNNENLTSKQNYENTILKHNNENLVLKQSDQESTLKQSNQGNLHAGNWTKWSATSLKMPVTSNLKQPKKLKFESPRTSWTERRRPALEGDTKDYYVELAKAKLEFVKLQQDKFEESQRIQKEREDIEFELKKTVLEYDIKIKKIQLEKLQKQTE